MMDFMITMDNYKNLSEKRISEMGDLAVDMGGDFEELFMEYIYINDASEQAKINRVNTANMMLYNAEDRRDYWEAMMTRLYIAALVNEEGVYEKIYDEATDIVTQMMLVCFTYGNFIIIDNEDFYEHLLEASVYVEDEYIDLESGYAIRLNYFDFRGSIWCLRYQESSYVWWSDSDPDFYDTGSKVIERKFYYEVGQNG